MSKHTLFRWRSEGHIEVLARGLYRRTDRDVADLELIEIAHKAPLATICLTSALVRHALSDEIPQVVRSFPSYACAVAQSSGNPSVSAAPTRATVAGRAYLALQRKARAEVRATDEPLQLFALEAFVDRFVLRDVAQYLVLNGGVLLGMSDDGRCFADDPP